MDKISLEEMIKYAEEVIGLADSVCTVKNENEVDCKRASEIKRVIYDDWCSRFESLALAKYTLRGIIAHKDEYWEDDTTYLEEVLKYRKDDTIYELEATILAVLNYTNDDIKYY